MLETGDQAPKFSLRRLDESEWNRSGTEPVLLVFFETDCPTCQLALPYLNRLSALLGTDENVLGISQDEEGPTRDFVDQLQLRFPIGLDDGLKISRLFDPVAVPTIFLLDGEGRVAGTQSGLDKQGLNTIVAKLFLALGKTPQEIAGLYDGNPDRKLGCTSRHLEGALAAPSPSSLLHSRLASPASRIDLPATVDPYEYCIETFGDPLPVVPPTVERVERMLLATPLFAQEIVARIPPNYGIASVEKIAANAVMAGCRPEMMRILLPLVRASCDERFNLHGIQATTHSAAPLVIVNGPIRKELGFACGSNVFSNVSRANSTLGRALQLILVNLGGARPGEIDMSALGNPGKFSYCIAENEEESPWEPLHVELGFKPTDSTITMFAAEAPHGVSEHNAREGRQILKAVCRALATVWTYRLCSTHEAIVVLCPEHGKTLRRDGLSKQDVRMFLYENTGIPVRAYSEGDGEGTQYASSYTETSIEGERCFRKFREPNAIKIIVAGGTAGKFSAVIGSWATGPRGSQMVTYPIESTITGKT